jgi:hypothetical protein
MPNAVTPWRVRLEAESREHPAQPLDIGGHQATVRCPRALGVDDPVRLHLDWASGGVTTLPARVTHVAPLEGGDHLAQVEVTGVEGDWLRFLEFLGPQMLAR